MKNYLKQLFRWLDRISKDKYQHYALGSFLALIVFVVASPLFEIVGYIASFWISYVLSFFITVGLALLKEYYVDEYPNWKDILATFLGGAVVWIALVVSHS